jgi:predicted nucleic acid-binding protein
MNSCVVDASVVARWFLGEETDALVQRALTLLVEYRSGRLNLHAPELLFVEVPNVFWKQVRFAGLLPADANRAVAQLLAYEFVLHSHASLAGDAFELALAHRISVYDAAYVTLAKRGSVPLWTLDQKLARAVSGTVDVRIPEVTSSAAT